MRKTFVLAPLLLAWGCYQHARRDAPSSASERIMTELVTIPSLELTRGDMNGEPDEYPERKVRVSSFRMERTEVSNRAYTACVEARACDATPYLEDDRFSEPDQPVVGVSWVDADRYCQWIGRRLPSEVEWEAAAKGGDLRKWPWDGPFDAKKANTREAGLAKTAAVTAFAEGSSPYGVLQMSGNAAEWVADFYDPTLYRTSDESTDPKGPLSGRERSIRGGSYADTSYSARVSKRTGRIPTEIDATVGFRCAANTE